MQNATLPMIRPNYGQSYKQLMKELKIAIDIHIAEVKHKLFTGSGLPVDWMISREIKHATLWGDKLWDEDGGGIKNIQNEIRRCIAMDCDEDDVRRLSEFCIWDKSFVRAVPFQGKIYTIHEYASDCTPKTLEIDGIGEGPWQFSVETQERQSDYMSDISKGRLQVISEIIDGECFYDESFNESLADEIFQISDAIDKFEKNFTQSNQTPLWLLITNPNLCLLTIPTSTSVQCLNLMDELNEKHHSLCESALENSYIHDAKSELNRRLADVGAQMRELERQSIDLRNALCKAEVVSRAAFFGLKEGDVVVHMDDPVGAYQIKLIPDRHINWVPALYPADGSLLPDGQAATDKAALKRGKDFFSELRLGEWTNVNHALRDRQSEQAEQAFANYDFGDVMVTQVDGWQYVTSGNERTRKVYVETQSHNDGSAPGWQLTFTVQFNPRTGELADVYAIDSKGQIWGASPVDDSNQDCCAPSSN